MTKKQIVEIQEGDDVDGIFAVTRFEARDYQRGRYLRLRLGDASGKVNGRHVGRRGNGRAVAAFGNAGPCCGPDGDVSQRRADYGLQIA